jgi:hypothetical protein
MKKKSKQKYAIPEYDPQTGERNPYWDELTEKEKIEGIPTPPGVVNMNDVPLDVQVDELYSRYQFLSTGDAYVICRLIDFYRENK